MEFVFFLLLIFFFTLIYVIPAIIVVVTVGFVIKWTVNKFSDVGEPNDFDAYNDSVCAICGDDEEWHKHGP
jgi:hypothetical protein